MPPTLKVLYEASEYLSHGSAFEEGVELAGELAEVVEPGREHLLDDPEIDFENAVDEDVTKVGDAAEARGEGARQDAELGRAVDRRGLVGDVAIG